MKYLSYFYLLCASAVCAYSQVTSVVIDESYDGLTWANAPWSSGVPASEDWASILIGDSTNAMSVEGAVVLGKLDVGASSYLLLTGAGNSLTTTLTGTGGVYGDIIFNSDSKLEVKNGAVLNTASGMSATFNGNSTMLVDAATFNGKFNGFVNSAVFQNGATWNISGFGGSTGYNILVKDSTMLSTGDVKMGSGVTGTETRALTLQNSSWDSNKKGINASGTLSLYDSSISNLDHFNVATESGGAKGANTLYLKGSSSEKLSSISATNLWWNTNKNSSSTLLQDGNTSLSFTKVNSDNNTDGGGNVLWLLQNDNNTISLSADATWGDNGKGKNETGSWLLTTAKTVEGVETVATNSSMTLNSINVRASSVVDNNLKSKVDWAGATNSFTARYDIRLYQSTAATSQAESSFVLRDGATATVNRYILLGSDGGTGLSGTASLKVQNGSTLVQKSAINLINSINANSNALSEFVVDNATLERTGGNLNIGVGSNSAFTDPKQDAISGTSVVTFKNNGNMTYTGGILLAGSSVDAQSHSNVAKLTVENTKLTITGELYFGHSQSNGSTIYGGTSILEVSGEDSAFISQNKGLYSGYNTTTYGGDRHINVTGKNNEVYFKEIFYMNSANGAVQNGGSFDVNIQGEGHTFTSKFIDIGKVNATAGSNKITITGTNSENLNMLLLTDTSLYIKNSAVAGSTVENSVIFAGNSMLQRATGENVNVNVGYNDSPIAGTASFIVKGSGNQIYGQTLNLGNSTGGKAIFRIEGYSNNVSFADTMFIRGSGDTYENLVGGRMEFVVDNAGRSGDIAMISTNTIGEFSGALLIDFSNLTGNFEDEKFLLISAVNAWDSLYNTWASKNLVSYKLRGDTDTALLSYEDGNVYVTYSSYVPEPATYAAIFGALALAFVAYKRRKQ